MSAKDYIRWIRSKVGHGKIILTFAGGCIFKETLIKHGGLFSSHVVPLNLEKS